MSSKYQQLRSLLLEKINELPESLTIGSHSHLNDPKRRILNAINLIDSVIQKEGSQGANKSRPARAEMNHLITIYTALKDKSNHNNPPPERSPFSNRMDLDIVLIDTNKKKKK